MKISSENKYRNNIVPFVSQIEAKLMDLKTYIQLRFYAI